MPFNSHKESEAAEPSDCLTLKGNVGCMLPVSELVWLQPDGRGSGHS